MEALQVRQARSLVLEQNDNRGRCRDSGDMERRRGRAEPVCGRRVWPEMGEDGEGRHKSERRIDGVALGVVGGGG